MATLLRTRFLSLLVVTLTSSTTSWAIMPFEATEAEKALLPFYCQPGFDKSRLGKIDGFNHYCYAMNFINRSYKSGISETERTYYIEMAIREFQYVERRATPEFVLLPEMYVKMAELLGRLKRDPEAMEYYQKAIALKPSYSKIYASMSNFYRLRGDLKAAKQILEDGLKAAPKSKLLKRRLKEFEQ